MFSVKYWADQLVMLNYSQNVNSKHHLMSNIGKTFRIYPIMGTQPIIHVPHPFTLYVLKALPGPLSDSKRSCTIHSVTRHSRPVKPVQALVGMDERLISLGFSNPDFQKSNSVDRSLLCCILDMLGHTVIPHPVKLAVLPQLVWQIELDYSRSLFP